jgi:hypothetical protein
MGPEQRINSCKHISGEYCKVPVKGGHIWPWVRDCVVDSEIEASWAQWCSNFSSDDECLYYTRESTHSDHVN